MDDREIEAVVRVLRSKSSFRFYGPDLQKEAETFEEEFARCMVPAYLWVSVVAAVVNQGAIPILADIDETFGLDFRDVERQITSRTSGIIMVHMSGAPGDVKSGECLDTCERLVPAGGLRPVFRGQHR